MVFGIDLFPALEMTSIEAQLGMTALILLVAIVLNTILFPRVVRLLRARSAQYSPAGRVEDATELAKDALPLSIAATVLVRLVHLSIAAAVAVALVGVWGRVEWAIELLGFLELAVPATFRAVVTAALFGVAYVASGVLHDTVSRFAAHSDRLTRHQEEVAYRSLQICLFGLVILMALTIWNVDVGGLLIGAGFLGIIFGLAAQQTLGALIAGFVLMFSRPFEIGDWVEIGDEEGIVTDITVINTRLENFDGESVVIPNDRVGDSVVINRTRKGRLRIRVDVGVDYTVDPDWATEVAEEALAGIDEVLRVPAPDVVPKQLADSAVVLELRGWIDKPSARRRWRARSAMIRSVKAAFEREGIKIPFPQREMSGRAETGGFRIADEGSGIEPTDEERSVSQPDG